MRLSSSQQLCVQSLQCKAHAVHFTTPLVVALLSFVDLTAGVAPLPPSTPTPTSPSTPAPISPSAQDLPRLPSTAPLSPCSPPLLPPTPPPRPPYPPPRQPPPLASPPPVLPPFPPLVPGPEGFITVINAAQLHDAINATPTKGSLSVFIPSGTHLYMEGRPITVGAIDLHVQSNNSLIDAQSLSRIFDFKSGAHASLHGLTLANGYSSGEGGCMVIPSGVSVWFSRCTFTNCTAANGRGGSLVVSGGEVVALECLFSRSTARSAWGGTFHIESGQLLASHIVVLLSEAAFGGALSAQGGVFRMNSSRFERPSAFNSAGCMLIWSRAQVAFHACSFFDCVCEDNGGTASIGGGRVDFVGCTIIQSRSFNAGGSFFLWGSSTTFLLATSIINSTSTDGGGAITLASNLIVRDCLFDGSTCTDKSGGALQVNDGASMSVFHTTITRSHSHQEGGCIISSGGVSAAIARLIDCRIEHSTAGDFGGAVRCFGGLNMTRCLLAHSSAKIVGGTISIASCPCSTAAESFVLVDSVIQDTSNGCFHLQSGYLTIFRSIVDLVAAFSGGAILASTDPRGDGRLPTIFLATLTEFKLHDCSGVLIGQDNSLQYATDVVLRDVHFSPQSGCNVTTLASQDSFDSRSSYLKCGDLYGKNPDIELFTDVGQWPVCGSTAQGACELHPLEHIPLHSISCSCPEVINPTFWDAQAAVYELNGCITPLQLSRLEYSAKEMSVILDKGFGKPRHARRNATLQLVGTSTTGAANWTILNRLPEEVARWLHIVIVEGVVEQEAAVAVPMIFTLINASEGTYTAKLDFQVYSAILTTTGTLDVSFIVRAELASASWLSNPSHAVCNEDLITLLSYNVTASTPFPANFLTCDMDNLPLDHLEDVLKIFSLSLLTSAQPFPVPIQRSIEYIGQGQYYFDIAFTIHGWFQLALRMNSGREVILSGRAICGQENIPLPQGRCGCAGGQIQLTSESRCETCPHGTSSMPGTIGRDCLICAQGFYRPSAQDAPSSCVLCPPGGVCALNATRETIILRDGYWRLTPHSSIIEQCPMTSACVGGSYSGACSSQFDNRSFLCSTCADLDSYLDKKSESCLVCPSSVQQAFVALAVLAGAVILILGFAHLPNCIKLLSPLAQRRALSILSCGIAQKARILLALYQCLLPAPEIFVVTFSDFYNRFIDVVRWIELDWMYFVFPNQGCLGSFRARMLLNALLPIAALLVLFFVQLVRMVVLQRRSVRHVLVQVASVGLYVAFIFTPPVSRTIFSVWDCVPFESAPGEERYFLRVSPTITCDSDEHAQLVGTAIPLVALWPVGMLLLFLVLTIACRREVKHGIQGQFVHAISFLHADFKPRYFYWAPLELLQRLILTGGLLLLPANTAFLRVMVALFVSQLVTVVTVAARPFRRGEDNILYVMTLCSLMLFYTTITYIKMHDDLIHETEQLTLPRYENGAPQLVERVLGFSGVSGLIDVALSVNLGLVLAILLLFRQIEREVSIGILKYADGTPPVLTLEPFLKFHVFLSHTWTSGQDQVALIKHQLKLIMPGISAFLDVDDLQDIRYLEKYVAQTMLLLPFWSKSYFLSRNCQRELLAALMWRKPMFAVHETDEKHGGVNLESLRNECPEKLDGFEIEPGSSSVSLWESNDWFELAAARGMDFGHLPINRDSLFFQKHVLRDVMEQGNVTYYSRTRDMQLVSMREIAVAILRLMPAQIERGLQEAVKDAYISGSITQSRIKLPRQRTQLYASSHNPGASDVVEKLVALLHDHELANTTRQDLLRSTNELPSSITQPATDTAEVRPLDALRRLRSRASTFRLRHVSSLQVRRMPASSTHPRARVQEESGQALQRAFYFVLWLDRLTFLESKGDILAKEIRLAMEKNVKFILIHDKLSCSFEVFFHNAPQDLIERGLFRKIALAFFPGPQALVTAIHVAHAIHH